MIKNRLLQKAIPALTLIVFLLSACSKDNDHPAAPGNNAAARYAILSGDMTLPPYAGNVTTYASIPSGDLNNIASGSLPITTNGLRSFGKWAFKRVSAAGQAGADGVQRYSMSADGQLTEDKMISSGGGSNFLVYNETTGFYFDANRGLLKIQQFNPSTMERTGEIDLSAVANSNYAYQAVGSSLMVAKEGKLFVDILHGSATGKGSFFTDPAPGFVELAVIDIASGKYEKTIRLDGISYIGYPGNENQMWTLGDDGALYCCSHGFGPTGAINGSAIVRINKGQTEFDKNWIIKADNFTQGTSFGTVAVKDGKLYTQIGSAAINFVTLNTDVIYDYYAFDVNNVAAAPVKITGMPATTYAFQNAQCITIIDDKVYFRVVNPEAQKNGYYVLNDANTAAPVFNVTSGGQVWGFVKLTN